MIDDRPQAERILIAQLAGTAWHHARWRKLTSEEHAGAVAALRELAGGRVDLLAEVAGTALGFSEGPSYTLDCGAGCRQVTVAAPCSFGCLPWAVTGLRERFGRVR
jgi:hypothetical protein